MISKLAFVNKNYTFWSLKEGSYGGTLRRIVLSQNIEKGLASRFLAQGIGFKF